MLEDRPTSFFEGDSKGTLVLRNARWEARNGVSVVAAVAFWGRYTAGELQADLLPVAPDFARRSCEKLLRKESVDLAPLTVAGSRLGSRLGGLLLPPSPTRSTVTDMILELCASTVPLQVTTSHNALEVPLEADLVKTIDFSTRSSHRRGPQRQPQQRLQDVSSTSTRLHPRISTRSNGNKRAWRLEQP